MRRVLAICVLVSVLPTGGFGQSLGDVAREARLTKSAEVGSRHVYTNDDFAPATGQQGEVERAMGSGSEQPLAPAAQWDAGSRVISEIREQKSHIAMMESRIREIEKLLDERETIGAGLTTDQRVLVLGTGNEAPFPGPCEISRATYYDPYKAWCEKAVRLESELDRREAELEKAQARLEELQEQARRMGYRSAVYDPD